MVFNYQSNHFILKSTQAHIYQSVDIPIGIACELQIRTLLQHAYSELSHDLIYKTKLQVEPDVKRLAARSMALIETTDEVFGRVRTKIAQKEGPYQALLARAAEILRVNGIDDWSVIANEIIVDAIREFITTLSIDELNEYYSDRAYIFERLRELGGENPIYKTPAVLILIALIPTATARIIDSWPYTPSDLEPLFTMVGRSFPDL